MTRRYTKLIVDDIENGLLTSKFILDNLLEWLSEEEVEEFAKSKIYTEDEEEEDMYTVWVGGIEVVDKYVVYKTAKEIRNRFKSEGYDDVIISIV